MLDYGHHRQSDFENKIVVLGYVTIGFDERKTCKYSTSQGTLVIRTIRQGKDNEWKKRKRVYKKLDQ
jgi:hypothetical protein